MTEMLPISSRIWDMKYRLKAADGTPVDGTIEDTWRRVARALAAAEAEPARWEPAFYDALAGFRFLPAGRILAGAGAERQVTLFNCFVMGRVADDMTAIFDNLKEAALTMQQGGGIGYDFSTLRPKGAPVKGVGADASGPLPFMDCWDAMCRTIMSAGFRRGAMMGCLRCDHPDIEAFIEAKRDPGRLRMFNLSVLVTDSFMQAVKDNASWELAFEGVVYRTVQARALWERIIRSTYAYAEPGVIFIDRINRANNLAYCEEIFATNPCITADGWIQTSNGPRQVRELVGRPFEAIVNGAVSQSDPRGFFPTGRRQVLNLLTEEGYRLSLTPNHRVRRVTRSLRRIIETEWVETRHLRPGDEILVHDHRGTPGWSGSHTESEGYLIGLLIGDGTLKDDAAVLSAWPGALAANGGYERPGVHAVMDAAHDAARTLRHRSDFRGWHAIPGRGEYRMKLGALRHLAKDLGLRPARKAVTPVMHRTSAAFHVGFLRGLFDSDGSVQGNHGKGISVRLAQSDEQLLVEVQRMLLRLGVASRLYRNRRAEGRQRLPDGRGGLREYSVRANHELVISRENILRFHRLIGFHDRDKARKLEIALAGYRRRLNRERFAVTVRAMEPVGEEEVFDVAIPGVNAFDANGLVVHNCGEQPLPPYGACLLGSINLASLVRNPFEQDATLDMAALEALTATAVRMLDNAIDCSRFPIAAQREEAQAKRRIGLGVTGLADALIMCRARYGGATANGLIARWMGGLQRAAYLASAKLAGEKGAFPLYDAARYAESPTIQGLGDDVRAAIAASGVRNALLTSVAPTGTISLLAGNVSSGIEPVFSYSYTRNVLMPDGSRRAETVDDHAYLLFRRLKGDAAALPDYFVDAQSLRPADHLAVQAQAQAFVDSSISKTINCPEEMAFDDFRDVYMRAYDLGCKGCTTYRPNPVTGAVLEGASGRAAVSTPAAGAGGAAPPQAEVPVRLPVARQSELPLDPPPAKPADAFEAGGVIHMTRPLERPEALQGSTYKIRWPEHDHAIYITINDIVRDGRRQPFEIFINSKNTEHYAWTVALTRMISAVFRRGGDVSFIVEELKAVFDPRGGQWVGGHYVPSILAAIGGVIEQHLVTIGALAPPEAEAARLEPPTVDGGGAPAGSVRICVRCGQPGLLHREGCDMCPACGYSKCA